MSETHETKRGFTDETQVTAVLRSIVRRPG
jgi:hypothetical protein